jgi:hypothetical protein
MRSGSGKLREIFCTSLGKKEIEGKQIHENKVRPVGIWRFFFGGGIVGERARHRPEPKAGFKGRRVNQINRKVTVIGFWLSLFGCC